MTNLDQFESAFKSADRQPFAEESITLDKILVVTDASGQDAEQFTYQLHQCLGGLHDSAQSPYACVTGDQFSNVEELMSLIEQAQPDLICTVRNLHDPIPELPYSLGAYVDVMTQIISCPVMLIPRNNNWEKIKTVMAVTDHLSGDNHLVSYAAALTSTGGTLVLAHVEDEQAFRRYIHTIGKIPSIDTAEAEEVLREQLLKEPADYILSCQQVFQQRADQGFQVESVIILGHLLEDYKRLIERHQINLLVLNTKDEDQLAMHGLAYPLAIELREMPLLLL